jgi:hypothetical protein
MFGLNTSIDKEMAKIFKNTAPIQVRAFLVLILLKPEWI